MRSFFTTAGAAARGGVFAVENGGGTNNDTHRTHAEQYHPRFTVLPDLTWDTRTASAFLDLKMDFSSTHAALRSLKRRSTTSDTLRTLAEKLEGPFAGELRGVS